jgi:hypothetical protein
MGRMKVIPLLVAVSLGWAFDRQTQERPDPFPPGRIEANDALRRFEKTLEQDRLRPHTPQLDYEKVRADAGRLLALAGQIHGQLQAGPQQIPAQMNEELKEVEKLAKRLRRSLLF